MAEAAFTSYKNKLVDFGIKADSFTGDDGKAIDYKQLTIVVELDGAKEELTLSGKNAPSPKLLSAVLKGATNQTIEGSLLD